MKPIHEQFADWVAKQDPAQRYIYVDNFRCPYAQFLGSRGIRAVVDPRKWIGLLWFVIPCFGRVPPEIDAAIKSDGRWTFGALAERLAVQS